VTDTGGAAVDIAGWKIDDSSESFAAAARLNGVSSIAAGESVIFIETADLPGTSGRDEDCHRGDADDDGDNAVPVAENIGARLDSRWRRRSRGSPHRKTARTSRFAA
jgi:hypothetical protein